MAKTFDGPPTLERSGSEHRRAVISRRDLGLGYRVRTLPLGRDRWGIHSTVGRFPSSRLRREDRDERWSLL